MPLRAVTSRRRARVRPARAAGTTAGTATRTAVGTATRTAVGTAAGRLTVVVTVGLLAGCAEAASVAAAPFADDPVCAEVILALPQVLADAERVDTTSQGTAAWAHGSARDAIVLRCGVEPLAPTTDRCVTADDGAGTSVDWVTVPGDEVTGEPWRFTTYGRVPAVEVTVPTSVTSERSTSVLVDLGVAVSHAPQERRCL